MVWSESVWRSEPIKWSFNAILVADDFIFNNASKDDAYLFDKETGKIVSRFNFGYACTRFTVSGPFVMGANMDMIDLSDSNRLASTGPCVDSRECVGSAVSNGRVFYTSQASGLQVCQVAGDEAAETVPPWERP